MNTRFLHLTLVDVLNVKFEITENMEVSQSATLLLAIILLFDHQISVSSD